MTPAQILALIAAGETVITQAIAAYTSLKATLSATTQAQIEAQIAQSGASLDSLRAQFDAATA